MLHLITCFMPCIILAAWGFSGPTPYWVYNLASRNVNVIKENYWKILVEKKYLRVKRNICTLNFFKASPRTHLDTIASSESFSIGCQDFVSPKSVNRMKLSSRAQLNVSLNLWFLPCLEWMDGSKAIRVWTVKCREFIY